MKKIRLKTKPIKSGARLTENTPIKFYMPVDNGGMRYFGKSDITVSPKSGKEVAIVLSDKNSKLVDEFLTKNIVPTVIGENSYLGIDALGNYVRYTNVYECVIGKCDFWIATDEIDKDGKLPKESVSIVFIPKSFKKMFTIPNRLKDGYVDLNKEKNFISPLKLGGKDNCLG